MRDSRAGESLWQEWEGEGLEAGGLTYFTFDHVDPENDIVQRALASRLQRDGVADGLGAAYRLLAAETYTRHGWAGYLPGESELTVCEQGGETALGDQVEAAQAVTWIEVPE